RPGVVEQEDRRHRARWHAEQHEEPPRRAAEVEAPDALHAECEEHEEERPHDRPGEPDHGEHGVAGRRDDRLIGRDPRDEEAEPSESLGLEAREVDEPEPQVGEAEEEARPGGVDDRRVAVRLQQHERRQHHLRGADEQVQGCGTAAGDEPERGEAVDEQHDADEQQADVAHQRVTSSMNCWELITGAKKVLMRRNAAASSAGSWVPVASPITIGSRPWSRAARALPSMHQSVWMPVMTTTSTLRRASVPGRSVPTNAVCRAVSLNCLSPGSTSSASSGTSASSQAICSGVASIAPVQWAYWAASNTVCG